MSDELSSLRTDSLSHFRWTAGTCLSLITITLTVLTLYGVDKIDWWHRGFAYPTTVLSVTAVFFSWLAAQNYLRVRAIIGEYNRQQRFSLDTDEEELKTKTKRAKPLGKVVTVLFVLSIVSFIGYLVSYIRW